jgi:hypothetical protein
MPETDNDPSASTASFRAFAQRPDEDVRGRRTSSNRTMIMAGAVVCALIVIVVLFAVL